MSVREMAREFDTIALEQIAAAASHKARLLRELEAKPWRRSAEQNAAIDTFEQLAAYCRRVLAMAQE